MSLFHGHPGDEETALVDSLSPRERQLLEMATNGHTDQAIANELGISLATVSTYWGRIRIKYGPLGRTEIVARYLRALMNRATSEMQASESRMRTVLEALPVGVFLADASGQPVYVNSAYVAIAGKDESELQQHGLASLVFPDDESKASEDRKRCLAEGQGYVTEHRWVRGDGSVVWIRLHSEAWRLDGQIAGRVGVVEDVTIEREARERATQAEERYRLLFELAPEAVISVDSEYIIADFNALAQRMFGYSLHEIVGKPLSTLIPDRFRSDHRHHIETFGKGTIAAARPMAARSEVRGLRQDGTEFPCEASIVRQLFDGQPHYTAIVRDVSDRTRVVAPADPLESLPLPAWRLDCDRQLIETNSKLRQLLGGPKTVAEFFPPEDAAAYQDALDKSVGLGTGVANLRLGDRWHRCQAGRSEDGGWIILGSDIHEIELAAEESRRIRTLLDELRNPNLG